jgi:hypothetical protein
MFEKEIILKEQLPARCLFLCSPGTSSSSTSILDMDGNGRVGRFLMNTMMASGGYPWTVIPVTDRNAYVNALEKACVGENIAPLADFLAVLVKKRLAGEPLPAVPKASPVVEP